MGFGAEEWGRKGATLSDKTARSGYGLTQEEIYAVIDTGIVPNDVGFSRGSIWSHHGQQ